MAWSFRRRIKIMLGVHLNLSRSGISTSIGVKGASMTFGRNGTYLNTSVPLLGVYNRQKLPTGNSNPQPDYPVWQAERLDNIFSADVHGITSQNMQGMKEAIILARQQRQELKHDLVQIQSVLAKSKMKLTLSYILLYGFIKKTIPANLKVDIEAQKEAIEQTQEQIDKCYIQLDVELDSGFRKKYDVLVDAFQKLTTCHKIWDVTSAHFQDRIVARSSASTVVNRRRVSFAIQSLPDIKSSFEALYFQNANGADLYFYPSFIVMHSSKSEFAIIGFDEIDLQHSYVRFTETESVPQDSKVIDKTWVKVNKNGTPDRRFKGNYQIPVVRYGEIRLRTNTGLNEEYEFSNCEFAEEFGKVFKDYQAMIKRAQPFNGV
ncbi:DUF4236 domain-containing protein [Olivibacter sitiensis]|uniref:DUF4236 domain-containing protein n=1 Tax=Olivibacter sitiensis TaxID=376470 RepID=UPI0004860BA4|nr:DUF4236 domain-containing protein [Olivibacter sitiensis]